MDPDLQGDVRNCRDQVVMQICCVTTTNCVLLRNWNEPNNEYDAITKCPLQIRSVVGRLFQSLDIHEIRFACSKNRNHRGSSVPQLFSCRLIGTAERQSEKD
jgi:hypothetical protein